MGTGRSSMVDQTAEQDDAFCGEVLAASRSSFALPIRLLPTAKRRAMTALYAFCRRADDIVDAPAPATAAGIDDEHRERRQAELASFRQGFTSAVAGGDCEDPVLRAMARVVRAYAIPTRALFAVLDGVEQDLALEQYAGNKACLFESLDELHRYCRRVASAVGLASIHIWGFNGPAALPAADACGLAFQLTNILRDVTEDLDRGRIYLPREDLAACGVSPELLRQAAAGTASLEDRGLVRLRDQFVVHTQQLYAEAARLDRFLSRDGRRIFRAMFGIYRSIFAAVASAGTGIFHVRPKPTRLRLLGSLAVTSFAGTDGRSTVSSGSRCAVTPKRGVDGEPLPLVVVGGGLAGLAAAASLVEAGLIEQGTPVRLLESRRHVGGRAASFADRETGGLVDACQHVAMGCCTNFLDLCERGGIGDQLRHDRELWFIGPDGKRAGCTPSTWLPPPLHLAPLLGAMPHFNLVEKMALARGMLQLVWWRPGRQQPEEAFAWLMDRGQPQRVIDLFWQPVLESALGDSIHQVSVEASRKVILEGFLAHRNAADLYVPCRPLGELFGGGLAGWLQSQGVQIDQSTVVSSLTYDDDGRVEAVMVDRRREDGEARIACRGVILAVPWRAAARLVPDEVPEGGDGLAGSPITGVHLWFDRPVIDLPHAVLLGRLSQWVFRSGDANEASESGYCQVVISGSHDLLGTDREQLLARVVGELRELFPAAREATLLDSRIVTDPTAVLSVRPGVDALRPAATTGVPNLFLAGDWTATGWPSTMEGAVRSGRLAAAACLTSCGAVQQTLKADLPSGLLVRLLTGGRA